MGESLIHAQEITYKYTSIPYLLDNYMKLTIACESPTKVAVSAAVEMILYFNGWYLNLSLGVCVSRSKQLAAI